MDWSEERYVRLYTRDTAEWLSWPWQARALFPLLIRKADRTGAIALGKLGRKGLALLVGLPLNVVEPGLDALVADGCVQEHPGYIIMPNFLEAQETRTRPVTDAERQQNTRDRRKAKLAELQGERHEPSRNVTAVTKSHDVTPVLSCAVPYCAELSLKEDSSTCVDLPTLESEVFAYWAEKLGHPRAILDDKRRKLLKARVAEGMDLALAKLAVDGVTVDIQAWPERSRFDGIEYVFESRASVEKFSDLAVKGNPKPKRLSTDIPQFVQTQEQEAERNRRALKAAGLDG